MVNVWYTQDYVMNENGEWVIPPAGFINSWIAGTDYVYKFTSGVMNQPVKIVLKMRFFLLNLVPFFSPPVMPPSKIDDIYP